MSKESNNRQLEIEELINSINPNIEIISEYINYKTPMKFRCKIDNHEWYTTLGKIKSGQGCAACNGKVAIKGKTDLWTTRPDIAKLLKFKEEGYSLMEGSRKPTVFICPKCGAEKVSPVRNITANNFYCNFCSDGFSYPEKFVISMLNQLKIDYISQLNKTTLNWCNRYKYDFYISSLNCIIETHGAQHYEKDFSNIGGRTLKQEKENDKKKENLAIKNKVKNYIIIDCRKSTLEWIRKSIINSELSNMFNLSDVDWVECHNFALSSMVKTVCDLWNTGKYNSNSLASELRISSSTVIKYLNNGTKANLCKYDGKTERILGSVNPVICITTGKKFNSIKEASEFYHIGNISACCIGTIKSAGKLADGTKLKWMYYSDYLKIDSNKLESSLLSEQTA